MDFLLAIENPPLCLDAALKRENLLERLLILCCILGLQGVDDYKDGSMILISLNQNNFVKTFLSIVLDIEGTRC